MSVQNFNDLHSHYGHQIVVARYETQEGEPVNAAIECIDCGEVLLDYDNEGENEPCTRCGQEVDSDTLVSYGDWKLCELCQGDI